jgi:hypothetical protein
MGSLKDLLKIAAVAALVVWASNNVTPVRRLIG